MAVTPELKPSLEANKAIESAYKTLLADITDLRGKVLSRTRVNPEILATYQKLFANFFRFSGDIGKRFFHGDWEWAAGLIGQHAMKEGENAMRDKNLLLAAPAIDLAGLAFDLANNKLIKFSKEE